MIRVARAAVIAVLAALVSWFAVTPSNAVAEPSAPPLVYAYDGLAHTAPANDATTERGPPATHDHSTVNDAADSWSIGASARLAGRTPRVTTAYDATTGVAELAQATGTTREPVRAASGGSGVLDQGGVAAKSLGGLDDLAARRAALGAPSAGPGVSPTLSRLDVDGMSSLYGTSGHGSAVSLRVNPISRTHAETDVLQQLANLGGANGARATMYIDYPAGLCGACGRSGAVLSMARQVGLSELRVVWPGGSTVLVP